MQIVKKKIKQATRHPLFYKMFGNDLELNVFVAEIASDAHWVLKQTLFISLTFFSRYKKFTNIEIDAQFFYNYSIHFNIY